MMPEDDEGDDLPLDPAEQITTGDVGNPAQVKKQRITAKKAQDLKTEQNEWFWSQALSTPAGRRVIWEILHNDLHYDEVRFGTIGQLQEINERATWMALGEQQYGMRFFNSLLQYDRTAVYLMLDENDPRFRPDKRQRGNRSDGRSG